MRCGDKKCSSWSVYGVDWLCLNGVLVGRL